MKIHRKFRETSPKLLFFAMQNSMYGMFKPENIVVTNGTTHCKLKQGIVVK